jgi:acetoin utilization deacetylase AcuC-like enzyme
VSPAARLVTIEQRREGDGAAGGAVPWILDGRGRRSPGYDDGRRLSEVQAGLMRHPRVSAAAADASSEEIEGALERLHEPRYLSALRDVRSHEPVLISELAEPGLEPDTPVCAQAVATAREGVGAAITAARRILTGARFSYALCRPPGHHAGPAWLGGYCYLNNAAAAAQTLHAGGVGPVAILDLDLHYPNGTSAIVAQMANAQLHSLHAWPVTNAPEDPVLPRTDREALVEFRTVPDAATYLDAVRASVAALARTAHVLVLSLGYDTVAGDPHGSWSFQPDIFSEIGRLLAASGLPICVIQEGGYALDTLADCSHAFATGLLEEHAA